MKKIVLTAIIIFGSIYIFFIPPEPVGFKIFMKLVPMALILTFAAMTPTFVSRNYKRTIIAGLLVCMIADGVIYWFLAGLITFFIGHVFYIFAFKSVSRNRVPIWAAIPLLLYGVFMAVLLAGSQFSVGQSVMGFAIIAYIAVILLMGWMAIRTRLKLTIVGALLFIFSDSVLAIDRFVLDIPYRDAFVMVTYYAAQVFIAASIGSRVIQYSVNRNNLIR
ncbi:lysoplasmalogenase [Sporosarcina sp. FSL W8-0480]|uniref:lysoplasmalogenase n=1 Tax=Sporosarcina sp. FSL W8-0480 TaxID=2954701 RepID=UPI0030D70034